MHAIISFLKEAVTRGPATGSNGCYCVADGQITARNLIMEAGVKFKSEVDFNVPADPLDAALARMKEIQSLTVKEQSVTVKSGRLHSTIKCIAEPVPPLPSLDVKWQACPAGLVDALGLCAPFLGERGWSLGICLRDGRVTAFSNAAGIDVALPKLKLAKPVLIAKETASFLIGQGNPDKYFAEDNALLFRWNDGRWMRSRLLDDKMPDNVDTLLSDETKLPIKIDQAFRDAYEDVAAMSDGTISMSPEGFEAIKESSTTRSELPIAVNRTSWWGTKFIGLVIPIATAWDPSHYPAKCPFIGPNFRGVVVGVSPRD